jgi:hypothetical protein
MMHFNAYCIWTRTHSSLSTSVSSLSYGRTEGWRREWGLGKGAWAKRVKATAEAVGAEGKLRTRYLLIVSLYRWEYTGTAAAMAAVYDCARK